MSGFHRNPFPALRRRRGRTILAATGRLFAKSSLLLGFLPFFAPAPAAEEALPPLPVYECAYLDHELPIADATDAGTWTAAPLAHLVNVVDGSEPAASTRFQALWSDGYLYVRVDCEDDDIRGKFTERDAPVFEEDAVEVFLNPSADLETYYEIDVNPLNTVFDALILNPGDLGKASILNGWNSRGLKTSIEVRQETEPGREGQPGWTVTFAIPFEAIYTAPNRPPEPGDRWRWNVYRIDRRAGGAGYQAWSPTGAVNFHVPGRFGILEFAR
jgi:hypothetical protein